MKTHIYFILDKSGSMGSRREATISGFNEYLDSIQKDENLKSARMTVTMFDTEFSDFCVDSLLSDVADLTTDTYAPSGTTALYDAVAHVLNIADKNVKKKHRALVVILTDGEENSSKEHSRQQIFDMIKSFEDRGNYTFVFLGCDQDVWLEGSKMNISAGNIQAFDGAQIDVAYRSLAVATSNYAGGAHSRTSDFWSADS